MRRIGAKSADESSCGMYVCIILNNILLSFGAKTQRKGTLGGASPGKGQEVKRTPAGEFNNKLHPQDNKRRVDLVVHLPEGSKLVDVSIVDPLCATHVRASA